MRAPPAILAAATATVLAGCFPPRDHAELPQVSDAMTASAGKQWNDASATQLMHGRDTMEANCTKCHSMPSVHHESDKDWPDVMKSMAKKAKLSADDETAMLRYVLAAESVTAKK